jgi:UDP-N-acetylglucosamine:LPS N-acetylglucosamine transferase
VQIRPEIPGEQALPLHLQVPVPPGDQGYDRAANALAEVAAARKPAVVIPPARPHDEQLTTARALASAGLAVTAEAWPHGRLWSALLGAALDRGKRVLLRSRRCGQPR